MKKQQNLIKGLVSILLIAFIISTTKAEIPFTEAKGIYVATKKEYKEISPFWAMVAVHGRLLERIRFFGFYTKEGRYDQPLFKKDDHIAALLLKLFPSEDGVQFVVDCNRDTFLKSLSKKENLKEINNIIQVLLSGKKNEDQITDLKNLVGRLTSNSTSAKQEWPKLLVNAYEQDQKGDPRYPKNMVIISLLSFFVKVADTREQLIKGLPLFFEEKSEVELDKPYNLKDYSQYKEKVIKNFPDFLQTPDAIEKLFFVCKGFEAYERSIAEPLTYRKDVSIKGASTTFPDCGETALRNFTMLLLSAGNGAIVTKEHVQFLEDNIKPVSEKKLTEDKFYLAFKKFILDYPDLTQGASKELHNAWAEVVSNLNGDKSPKKLELNDVQYGHSISSGTDAPLVYEIKSNFSQIGAISLINMLNVIARIIPDEELNEVWNIDKNERYRQVGKKLDRLCTLFSREDMMVTWKNEYTNDTKINSDFLTIIFIVNTKDAFKWRFQDGHFQIDRVNEDQPDWRVDFAYYPKYTDECEWIAAMFPRTNNIEKETKYVDVLPRIVLYNPSLRSLQGIQTTVKVVLNAKMKFFYPLINRWVSYSIYPDNPNFLVDITDFVASLSEEHKEIRQQAIESIMAKAKFENMLQQPILSLALKNNRIVASRIFMEGGANYEAADANRYMPIHWAVIRKKAALDILQILIDANINLDVKNDKGNTPLHVAVMSNNIEGLSSLLKATKSKKPTIDLANMDGFTPLHLAVMDGDLKVVAILLDQGANPNTTNQHDETSLMLIANKKNIAENEEPNYIEIIKMLLDKGADVNAKNGDWGNTCLDNATKNGHQKIAKFLESKGAKSGDDL